MALFHSSSVNLSGSAPVTLSMNAIVSRISESRVIRPLRSGRVISSSKLRTSLVFFALYAIPVRPLCQGAENLRCGSHCRSCRAGIRFLWRLGMALAVIGCTQPRLIIRAAIQSVSTIMSRPIVWHAPSWLRTLAKNSALSLTSSV